MTRAALSIVVLTCLLSASAAAQLSDADRQVAREHFERGSSAFERGDYGEASAEFRAAYALTHHADLLYNIYSAQERNGELEEAAEALEGYLRDSDPEAARREALELRLARLQVRIAQARLDAAEANAEVDRERAAAAVALEAEQAERAAAEARALEEREGRLSQMRSAQGTSDALFHSGVVLMVAGGVGLGSFGVLAALSESEDQSLAASCGRDAGRVCSEGDVSALRTLNTAADVSWIGGAGLLAVGAVVVLIGESLRPAEDVSASGETAWISPVVSPTSAGVMLGGAW